MVEKTIIYCSIDKRLFAGYTTEGEGFITFQCHVSITFAYQSDSGLARVEKKKNPSTQGLNLQVKADFEKNIF